MKDEAALAPRGRPWARNSRLRQAAFQDVNLGLGICPRGKRTPRDWRISFLRWLVCGKHGSPFVTDARGTNTRMSSRNLVPRCRDAGLASFILTPVDGGGFQKPVVLRPTY